MSKSPCRLLKAPFYRGFSTNKEGPGTSFQAIFFIEKFNKIFSLEVLHKVAEFHHHTVFNSQVIQ